MPEEVLEDVISVVERWKYAYFFDMVVNVQLIDQISCSIGTVIEICQKETVVLHFPLLNPLYFIYVIGYHQVIV